MGMVVLGVVYVRTFHFEKLATMRSLHRFQVSLPRKSET